MRFPPARNDARHARRGYRVLRITWRRLVDEEVAMVVDVARALYH